MAGNKRIKRRIEKARKTVDSLFDLIEQLVDEASSARKPPATAALRPRAAAGGKPGKLTAVDKHLIGAIRSAKRGISVAELAAKVKRPTAVIAPRLRRLRRQAAIRSRGRTKATRYFAA